MQINHEIIEKNTFSYPNRCVYQLCHFGRNRAIDLCQRGKPTFAQYEAMDCP